MVCNNNDVNDDKLSTNLSFPRRRSSTHTVKGVQATACSPKVICPPSALLASRNVPSPEDYRKTTSTSLYGRGYTYLGQYGLLRSLELGSPQVNGSGLGNKANVGREPDTMLPSASTTLLHVDYGLQFEI
jgi:hypothetical protein